MLLELPGFNHRLRCLSLAGAFMVAANAFSAPDRVNHFHNDGNAGAAGTVLTNFGAFTSSSAGLEPKILGNLDAQLGLIERADDISLKLHETDFISATGQKTWLGLRARIWRDFGIITTNDLAKFEDAGDTMLGSLRAEIETHDLDVATRITIRIQKVQALGKVLQALAEGQAALAKKAAGTLKDLSTKLSAYTNLPAVQSPSANTNSSKPTGTNQTTLTTNPPPILDMLNQLQNDIVVAGRRWVTNAAVRTNATALQKQILAEAEQSRDPASAYALVALIGKGLRTNDLTALDEFLLILQQRLTNHVDVRTSGTAAETAPAAAERSIEKPAKAHIKTRLQSLLTERQQPESASQGQPIEAASTSEEQRFTNSWRAAYQLIASARDEKGLTNVTQEVTALGTLVPELGAALSAEATGAHAEPGNLLEQIAVALPRAAESVADNAKELQQELTGVQRLMQDTNLIRGVVSHLPHPKMLGPITLPTWVSEGVSLANSTNLFASLLGIASLDASVNRALTNTLSPENQKLANQWLQIGKDIQSEAVAAGARLLKYFYELSQTEASLYQENARHYTALGGIGAKEIRRWDWLGELNEQNARRFEFVTNNSFSPDSAVAPESRLFMTGAALESFHDFYASRTGKERSSFESRGFTNRWDGLLLPPPVVPTDQVLPSLRLLAEHAQARQWGSPGQTDPLGFYTATALRRLEQAVEAVQSTTFIINFNRRQSAFLHRLLLREIKEHSIHVDTTVLNTYEANIRLQVGDSLAFHSSGITDADLQLIISTIQAGFVGWIGSKH